MGADLCGYIMCGPKTLSKRRVEKARMWLKKVVAQAKANDKEGAELKRLLQDGNIVDQVSGGSDDTDDAVEAIAGMGTLLNEFLRVWDGGGFRDQMTRDMPFKTGWQIVVVGERTWGDGPEPNSAWGITEKADMIGLLRMLGID